MIYYAGHGVQLEGENYLLPVDAKISSPYDLDSNSLRLVDLMGTLEPSRAGCASSCSTPAATIRSRERQRRRAGPCDRRRAERLDRRLLDRAGHGSGGWRQQPQPVYVSLPRVAREPNLPIEQLFKRVRLEVNHATDGPPDALGKLVADLRFLFLRRYGGGGRPRAGSQPRSCRWRRTFPRGRYVRPTTTWCRRARRNTMRSSSGSIRTTRCATRSACCTEICKVARRGTRRCSRTRRSPTSRSTKTIPTASTRQPR